MSNRDERGWRIPRPGTRSRRIYDLLCEGLSTGKIHSIVGGSYATTGFLIWKIKHPETANRLANLGPGCGRVDDTNPRMRRPDWRKTAP
jgi:hypothetical protein